MSEKTKYDDNWRKDVINTRLITGQVLPMQRKHIVGYCHCNTHKGCLTKALMAKHGCVEKKCTFFQKFEYASYWIGIQNKKEEKQRRKDRKKAIKSEEQAVLHRMDSIKKLFQDALDEHKLPVMIVRVSEVNNNTLKVFYASDNSCDDRCVFNGLLCEMKSVFPEVVILMHHIIDKDGNFVTRNQYKAQLKDQV